MKLVVNTRLLRKHQMDGIGWFTYNTLRYIVKQNPHIEFHFLFDSGADEEFLFADNVVPHNLFPPAKHALLNVIWFEVSVRIMLKKLNPDLFLSPDGSLCLGWKGKQYGVLHDINYHHSPGDLKWSNARYYNYFFPRYARRACRMGTVSEYSKQDIVRTYKTDPGKIDVVYCGVNLFFKPVPEKERIEVRKELTGGVDYFIFVGTLHPRKNIIRLLQAFELFRKETRAPVKLVVAGKNMYKVNEIYNQHQQMEHKADVVFTGRLPDEKLNLFLGSALACTFVPVFEGFGMPIIEAMQCEIPVICSNVTSMPEVAGHAALLVDPFNPREISDAMTKIYRDKELRTELVARGKLRKDFFSWEKTASLLWEGINKCL